MERHKEGYESEMEVSSVDYLSDEFTIQSSSEDEMSDYDDSQPDSCSKSRKSSTSTPSINQVCMHACVGVCCMWVCGLWHTSARCVVHCECKLL